MQSTICLLTLLLFLYFVYGSSTIIPSVLSKKEQINYDLTVRIVNGTKAVLEQFPYQVSLQRSDTGNHFCGGNIISKRLVLTAGHCVFNIYKGEGTIPEKDILVVGGLVELNNPISATQFMEVKTIKLHPEFDLWTLKNDVAVLILVAPFDFTRFVHSAPLPADPPKTGAICQVAGWGYLEEDIRRVSDDLMFVDLPILAMKTCNNMLRNKTILLPGMYCAGYAKGEKDSCQGDSGGGMICDGILTGIVSGGYGCAHPQAPGIYTDIYFFKDWIVGDEYVEIKERCSGSKTLASTVMILCSLFLGLISIMSLIYN